MQMPGKFRKVVLWIFVAEVVQQEEGIEVLRFAEAKGALQLHAGAFEGRRSLNDPLNWAE